MCLVNSAEEIDKNYLFVNCIWDINSKDDPLPWILGLNACFPEFMTDLLTYQIGNHAFDTLRIEFPSIIELLQDGLMVEPKYRNSIIYNCTVYKGFEAKQEFWESRQIRLTYQHRMHSDISRFIRNNFYQGIQVLDPDGSNNTYCLDDERQFPFRSGPHNVWIHVRGEEIKGRSYRNQEEVEQLYNFYCDFERWATNNPRPKKNAKDDGIWNIAIITFYLGQQNEISRKFKQHFKPKIGKYNFKDEDHNIKIKICTMVDSLQERSDLVLLSFVRTEAVGFLDSRNQLNVGLSRAKYYQALFGNVNFFKSNRVRKKFRILTELAENIPHITNLR